MSQKQRILEILRDQNWHSNIEIHETTGIYRYGARIFDLKRQGYDIKGWNGQGSVYYYQLISKQTNLI